MHLHLSSLAQVAILFSATVTARFSAQRRATVCNGYAELCERSFGNITFVGAHDSYAVSVNENVFTNQDQPITTQLNDGIRMLQSQVHNKNGVLQLCHSSCALQDSGPLVSYLQTVKSWMDANPNEVLSLLIVNIDNQPASSFDSVFKSAGLDSISYAPPSATLTASAWPSLGSMIDSGKRLVTFLDNQANYAAFPYLIDEFTNIWETAFGVTGTFDCAVNRTRGDTNTQMSLINHFLDRIVLGNPAPFKARANLTNAASGTGSLGEQVSLCASVNGRNPNFMLVDFYEFGGGSVFQVAAAANGVTYNPSKPVASPASSTSSGTQTGTGRSPVITSTPLGAASALTIEWKFALLAAAVAATWTL